MVEDKPTDTPESIEAALLVPCRFCEEKRPTAIVRRTRTTEFSELFGKMNYDVVDTACSDCGVREPIDIDEMIDYLCFITGWTPARIFSFVIAGWVEQLTNGD
tara:strand:- start:404 stop:712 length:309 start_codon:yes stop_codon:yes gene_type:complete